MSVTMVTLSAGDVHEPFADGQLRIVTGLGHDDSARHDLGDERNVKRIDPELPFDAWQRDHVDVVAVDDRVRRDDFQPQGVGHRCQWRPQRITSSRASRPPCLR